MQSKAKQRRKEKTRKREGGPRRKFRPEKVQVGMILRKRQTQGLMAVCCVMDHPSWVKVGVQSQRWRLESGVLACQWTLDPETDIKIEPCERWVD